jgi:hypothetical protein
MNLTKGPVPCEHEGEVGNDVEGGVDDVRRREIHCRRASLSFKGTVARDRVIIC